MIAQELRLTRRIVLLAVLAWLVAAALWNTSMFGPVWLAWMLTALVVVAVLGVMLWLFVKSIRMLAKPHSRPARFVVTPTGFAIPQLMGAHYAVVQQLVSLFMLMMFVVLGWRHADSGSPFLVLDVFLTILTVFVAAVVALIIVMAWRGIDVGLTPEGISFKSVMFVREIPWEALAPGGPLRPSSASLTIKLIAVRPELVRQRGWALMVGTRQQPRFPSQLDVHPWFLADAMRWYVEHPGDRAAIGTEAEHQRLLAALGA